MSTNLKFPLEIRTDGEGKLARLRNIKSATFHALPDSEIYTTEYVSFPRHAILVTNGVSRFSDFPMSHLLRSLIPYNSKNVDQIVLLNWDNLV